MMEDFSLVLSDEDNSQFDTRTAEEIKESQINDEINKFEKIIEETKSDYFSTANFWNKYSCDLPYLGKLAKILLNVPASSANIERFFSIAGVICKSRAANMSDELIIERSLLKVNLKLLDKLKHDL